MGRFGIQVVGMTISPRNHCLFGLVAAPLLGTVWFVSIVNAQIAAPPRPQAAGKATDPDDDVSDVADIFLPLDYSRQSKLDQADRLIRDEGYDDAVRILGELISEPADAKSSLGEPEDYFLRSGGGSTLKQEVQARIGALPPAGRAAYELHFGAAARKLLEHGLVERDMDAIEEASRRYLHTQAGQIATLLLARHYYDIGWPLAAARIYERVAQMPDAARYEPSLSVSSALSWRRAGRIDEARRVLSRLRQQRPQSDSLVLGDRELPLWREGDDPANWLASALGSQPTAPAVVPQEWAMFRGDGARNAPSQGSQPLMRPRWQAVSFLDASERKILERSWTRSLAKKQVLLPVLHPLAVRTTNERNEAVDAVVCRTPRHLLALDFRTGKVLWHVAAPLPNEIPDDRDEENSVPPGIGRQNQFGRGGDSTLEQRLWEDSIYGSLSTDGRLVFAIEDLTSSGPRGGTTFNIGGRVRWPEEFAYNRLVGRRLAARGEVAWQVGGERSGDGELSRVFFLGAPLVHGGRLYALAEVKREIRLVVLDAENGKLVWQQQLLPTKLGIAQEPLRRRVGASPSLAEGVLVCPTSAGSVVAVDLATRSLLWGFHYKDQIAGRVTPWGFQSMADRDDGVVGRRWADSSVTIADGRVLITPVEDDTLHCLNLLDGIRAWNRPVPRQDHLFVACVRDGIVLLVGRDHLTGLSLAENGRVIYRTPYSEPSAAAEAKRFPAGRGFASGEYYFLPLSGGEIIQARLPDGRIAARHASRHETGLGNLICYRGGVVSISLAGLQSFRQWDDVQRQVTEALAQRPDDPAALAQLGEIRLEEGQTAQAIDCLRRALKAEGSERTRAVAGRLLVDALLDGLEQDFASYKGALSEVEQLSDLLEDRQRFERIAASGWHRTGEHLKAFDLYMKMYDAGVTGELERIDARRGVQRDTWLGARLAELFPAAAPQDRIRIDAVAAARLEAATASANMTELRRFAKCFAGHPTAITAQQRLAEKLLAAGELLAAEEIWLRQVGHKDRTTRGVAVAGLAALLVKSGMPGDAGRWYAQLAGELADVVCRDGQTGRQLAREWAAARSNVALEGTSQWPAGRVFVEKGPRQAPRQDRLNKYYSPLALRGQMGALLQDVKLVIDREQHVMLGRDALGRDLFTVSLVPPSAVASDIDPLSCHIRAAGHVVILSTGSQVYALSTLGPRRDPRRNGGRFGLGATPGKNEPRVLWKYDIVEPPPADEFRFVERASENRQQLTTPWGEVRYYPWGAEGRPIGMLSNVTAAGLCFQREAELACVDPLTGATRWTTKNVPAGCDLWGDDEYLFAAPPSRSEALAFRAVDGEPLGTRRVPTTEQRLTTLGRRVVMWGMVGDRLQVGLFDPWTGEYAWQHPIRPGARAQRIGDDELAIFEPDGRLVVLNLADGQIRIDQQLLAEPRGADGKSLLQTIHVFADAQRLILVTNRNAATDRSGDGRFVWGGSAAPLVTGRIFALDRATGKPQWPVPAEVLDQGLLLHQPRDLPVLAFVRQVEDRAAGKRDAEIFCLDRRSGRTAARVSIDRTSASGMNVTGDPSRRVVKFAFAAQAVALHFTSQPQPPEAPAQADDFDPSLDWDPRKRAVGDFFKELGRSIAGPPEAEEELEEKVKE
jgi:outer membrane protein assembly factor BamB/tetratricopeptide (TPR) repeat protein